MDKLEIEQTISHLISSKESYSNILENPVIEKCCYIVEVGALTVTTDENGRVYAHDAEYPTQFSQKAVKDILTINWFNGNKDKVIPVVYGRNDWYRNRLKEIEESIDFFKTKITN
jgi:hypothetical protein